MKLMARQRGERLDKSGLELKDTVVHINRVTKVVKGGKNFSFSALVVVGDGRGHVGFGLGKAKEVPMAIAKGVERAKRNLVTVQLKGTTVAHTVIGHFGAGRVLLRPASPIAARSSRLVMYVMFAGIAYSTAISRLVGHRTNPPAIDRFIDPALSLGSGAANPSRDHRDQSPVPAGTHGRTYTSAHQVRLWPRFRSPNPVRRITSSIATAECTKVRNELPVICRPTF